MFINVTGFYIPQDRIGNDYFYNINGLTDDWITQRTGIKTRSRAKSHENINTMSMEAIEDALPKLPYDISEIDLIISASYSPYDTVATPAHLAQNKYGIKNVKAVYVSSACSSFVNAIEIVEGYFATGKASKALILSADKNSDYSNESDPTSGHLWGDAAAAFFISKDRVSGDDIQILDITTQGLGHIAKAATAVHLRPRDGGITMPEGRDVFVQACTVMPRNVLNLLDKNNIPLSDLSYFIGHQANKRIMDNISNQLNIDKDKFLHNIEELGNTGSVSSALVFAQNIDKFKKDDIIALTVFGGGYSAGAFIARK